MRAASAARFRCRDTFGMPRDRRWGILYVALPELRPPVTAASPTAPAARAPLTDLDALRAAFARGETWFASSPLYRTLSRTVAGDDELIKLASHVGAGPRPTNMLMAATHLMVLRHPTLAFARFFPSVVGADAEAPERAAAEYPVFCAAHRAELIDILSRRLVQTNVPGRGVSVRLALHEAARRVDGPVTFLEIGASAGIQLRFDRWAVHTGGRRFGPAGAPVTLRPEWRSDTPPPDLDAIPPITRRLGLDLHPIDAADPEQRLWLKALVWPEHVERFAELSAALDVVAADPPEILPGDAIDLLPVLDRELPTDVALVVFHAMVRVHVPAERHERFDAAVAGLARRRRLLHASLEIPPRKSPYDRSGHLLRLHDSAASGRDLALAEGHGRWIQPLAGD